MVKFKILGNQLKHLRLQRNKTLEETAKVANTDISTMSKVENGIRKPTEKTLRNLIAHYNLDIAEAQGILTLAGYHSAGHSEEPSVESSVKNANYMQERKQEPMITVPENLPVYYTDSTFVTSGEYGIVFDFAQKVGPTNNHRVVARVGLSVEHAKVLLKIMSKKIIDAERLQKENPKLKVKEEN